MQLPSCCLCIDQSVHSSNLVLVRKALTNCVGGFPSSFTINVCLTALPSALYIKSLALASAALAAEFARRFGHAPAYIARAPGRVNLIGEHIDYALFGVFPAAVEQDILIACAPAQPRSPPHSARPTINNTPGVVKAQNLSPKYGPQSFAPVLRT